MKLKINLEQEMTDEELDVLYEEFDIDGENKAAQLCFLTTESKTYRVNRTLSSFRLRLHFSENRWNSMCNFHKKVETILRTKS